MNKKVLLRQLQISWVPLVIAAIYAGIAYYSKEPNTRSVMILINYFSGTFFFLMWIVGQYLRTSKEINDSSNYLTLQTGIKDLQKAISKLQSYTFQVKAPSTQGNVMLASAKKAVENGFVLAGLMQAGVAFEQAILRKADRMQIPRDNRIMISRTINRLRDVYDDGKIKEFFAVWKLRNQLVHLTNEAAQELEKSPELIKYFEWAINELDND